DAAAIGDNINDAEMLKLVGKSYVISSAPPKVKKIGKYIVDGFKNAVEKIMEE
ncbi:MAG: HAD hydrolase family protein, partial [Clostridia bacterium]|nr:HAD hydrolase family protein [Clostridia bacterium]